MPSVDSIETTLRHDRRIVFAALTGIALVAWAYMIREARAMDATGVCQCAGMAMSGPDVKPWSAATILPLFLMWAEMMVAMMIPSAAPMILTFAMVNRKRREQERPFVPTGLFLSGYLLVWTAFSLFAALAQWALHGAALLSLTMKSSSPVLGGSLLVLAGVFQWTPWKQACLSHCRSPLQFIMTDWREGPGGAVAMGIKHGAYCTGCCWMLMALLFVAGVMNMYWVAAITLLVILEKVAPHGWKLLHVAGVILVGWGSWVIISGAT
jgi:predicted metal-binding membrane protein